MRNRVLHVLAIGAVFTGAIGAGRPVPPRDETAPIQVATPAPPATSVPSIARFSAEQAERWIPFTWQAGGLLVIPVLLNGAPARALVDSGTANVVLSRSYAAAHGLTLTSGGHAHSIGGLAHFDVTPDVSLAVGGWSQASGAMQVADLTAMNARLSQPVDIILGISLLSRGALQIDFDRKRFRLVPSGRRNFTGTDVPARLVDGGRRMVLQLNLDGRTVGPILIDTGSEGALLLASGTAATLPMPGRTTDLAVAGMGGIAVHQLITLDSAEAGPVALGTTLTTIEAPGGFLDHAGMAGSLGLAVLSGYNVSLDAAAGHLTLAPREHPDAPPPRSTVGVQGDYMADRFKVVHVMLHSPAEAAGLHDSDEICAVNGRSVVGWKGTAEAKWPLAPAGTPYSLSLCNGTAVKLVSADFY